MKIGEQIFFILLSIATARCALTPDNNLQQGDYIQLQVVSDACNNKMAPFLVTSGDKIVTADVEEKAFQITYLVGDHFQLKSLQNNFWLAANNWGDSYVLASKTQPVNPGWETFVFEKVGNGQIRIRTADKPQVYYWSANTVLHRNTLVYANKTVGINCELFNVYRCKLVYDGYCTPSVSDRVWTTSFEGYEVANAEVMNSIDADTDQACASQCHNLPGCTAWSRSKVAKCQLTRKGTGYRASGDKTSGPGANFWHYHAWNANASLAVYHDSTITGTSSENACSNLCSQNFACIAWSRNYITKTCLLYRSVAGDPISDASSNCGVRTLPIAPAFYNADNSLQTDSYVNIQASNGFWWRIDRGDSSGVVKLIETLNPYDAQQQFRVENFGSQRLALQSRANGLWMSSGASFSAKYPGGDAESWSFQRMSQFGSNKEQIQLKMMTSDLWITLASCQDKIKYPETCKSIDVSATKADHLETFNIHSLPDQSVRLKPDNSIQDGEFYQIQASNGLWWQVEDATGIVKLVPGSNPNDAGRWFRVSNWGAGEVQLQSRKTGMWLRANNNGGSNARFGAYNPNAWETFYYQQVSNGKLKQVRLKTNGGTYWITLGYSFLNDIDPCSKQPSVDRCTSINALASGQPDSWETFNFYSWEALRGANLGSWFVLERWMNSDVFAYTDDYHGTKLYTKDADDEWEWSEQQTAAVGRDQATKDRAVHWDNHITDRDFSWMAAHNINVVRIPVGYWLTLNEQELLHRYPFLPGGIGRLDRVFEVAQSYGIWIIISMHGAYGSQNGNDHSGHKGSVGFGTGTTVEDTANFAKTLAVRYADRPNFYGIGVINEPYIWDGFIPIPTLQHYLDLSSGYVRTAAPFAMSFMPDAFNLDKIFEFLPPFTGAQALESHFYRAFDSSAGNLDEQMNRYRNDAYNLGEAAKRSNYWTFIGECSNGALGSVFDGMTESQTYYAHKTYGDVQSDLWAKKAYHLGYTFWPYKITGDAYNWDEWSFRLALEKGLWPDTYVRK